MAERDRISELPAHILDNILGLLPIEEAAKTAVLSTIWKDIWFSLTKLNFDYDFFLYIAYEYSTGNGGYYWRDATIAGLDVINKIVMQHNGPIKKFVVDLSGEFQQYVPLSYDFDQWLFFLTQNGVEEIGLRLFDYRVPSYIFSCPTLKRLDLHGVSFELINAHYVLPNVISLSFDSVIFYCKNRLVRVFYLPMLENLSFDGCDDVFPFNIVAPKLDSLTIKYNGPDYRVLNFLPPNLDLRSISTLEFDYGTMEEFVEELTKAGQQPLTLNVEHLKVSIEDRLFIDLLQMCPKLCKLDISLESYMLYSETSDELLEELSSLTQTQKTLHTLKFNPFFGTRAEMQIIKVLLACFSRLEKVVIIPHGQFDFDKKFKIMQELLCFPRSSTNAKIIYI